MPAAFVHTPRRLPRWLQLERPGTVADELTRSWDGASAFTLTTGRPRWGRVLALVTTFVLLSFYSPPPPRIRGPLSSAPPGRWCWHPQDAPVLREWGPLPPPARAWCRARPGRGSTSRPSRGPSTTSRPPRSARTRAPGRDAAARAGAFPAVGEARGHCPGERGSGRGTWWASSVAPSPGGPGAAPAPALDHAPRGDLARDGHQRHRAGPHRRLCGARPLLGQGHARRRRPDRTVEAALSNAVVGDMPVEIRPTPTTASSAM